VLVETNHLVDAVGDQAKGGSVSDKRCKSDSRDELGHAASRNRESMVT
jgi:hypothetical protein